MTDVQLHHPQPPDEDGIRAENRVLASLVGEQRREIRHLKAELARAEAHIAHLERRKWWRK